MGKTIEVRLSDAQYAALSAEAEASGAKFFEHCRAKLLDGTALTDRKVLRDLESKQREMIAAREAVEQLPPHLRREPIAGPGPMPAPTHPADDRIARIEDAVARLTNLVLQGGAPTERYGFADLPAQEQPQEPQDPSTPIDVDSLVDAQFRDAEASGLTEHVPDETEREMAHSGVRALSRQPMRFSASSGPKHLAGL